MQRALGLLLVAVAAAILGAAAVRAGDALVRREVEPVEVIDLAPAPTTSQAPAPGEPTTTAPPPAPPPPATTSPPAPAPAPPPAPPSFDDDDDDDGGDDDGGDDDDD